MDENSTSGLYMIYKIQAIWRIWKFEEITWTELIFGKNIKYKTGKSFPLILKHVSI